MQSLSLIFGVVLLPAVYTLNCYQCVPTLSGTCLETQQQCPAGKNHCSSHTVVQYAGGSKLFTMQLKDCVSTEDCGEGSLNFGISKTTISSKCCNSDLCNTQAAPASGPGFPNGKKCYYCNGKTCTGILNCEGNEDHCIKATVNTGGQTVVVKGCGSSMVCSDKVKEDMAQMVGKDLSCSFTLKCYQSKNSETPKTETCPSTDNKCGMLRARWYEDGSKLLDEEKKSCVPDELCFDGSINIGTNKTAFSVRCCASDLCNTQSAPEISPSTPNGKKCYYCNGQTCTATLNCEGSEDHCITLRENVGGVTKAFKDCVTECSKFEVFPQSLTSKWKLLSGRFLQRHQQHKCRLPAPAVSANCLSHLLLTC